MKYKLFFITSPFLIIVLFFVSCQKYLDKKSDTSLVVPTALTDLQGLLDDYTVMNSKTSAFIEVSSDDYFVTEANYHSFYITDRQSYTWDLTHIVYQDDWANLYIPVYTSNYCLEQVDKIQKTSENKTAWNSVKGSALFYRAYYFLNLAWTFAKAYDSSTAQTDLGIAIRLSSDFNIPSVRSSVKDAYDQIIKDLKEANNYLPNLPSLHVAQPSKSASYALLARTYLSMRQYDSAFKYSDLSLQIKSDLLDYNGSDVGTGNVPFYAFNKEILFYTTEWTNFIAKHPAIALVDTTLYASYSDDDQRKSVFFRPNGNYRRFKGSYASSSTLLFTGIAVDEVYLIRAECNARAGRIAAGMADLNTLLSSRMVTGTFIPAVAGSVKEALDQILAERRKELLMRGIRWSDIKRLNKEGAGIVPKRIIDGQTYSLIPNESRYALPLPQDIIDLTGMPQN